MPFARAEMAYIMAQPNVNERRLKRALKEALTETLQEQRDLLHEVFAEVLEDFALVEAVRQGQTSKTAARAEVFRALRPKS